MAELVGGTILTAVIQTLVERLTSLKVDNLFQKNQSLPNLLEILEVKLWSTTSLHNDAEDKQVKDVLIKKWVDKLNEMLNVVDCLIGDISTETLRQEIQSKRAFWKKPMPSSLNLFDTKMKPKIEEIISRLDLLLTHKDYLGLKEGVQGKRLERFYFQVIRDSSDVHGKDSDKEAILDLIFSENVAVGEKISVIPIVGMGGIGKTTLAHLIYHDSRVKNHFEHRAWVTVSDDFDVFKLAKLVLEGLSAKGSEAKDIEKLGEELTQFLRGKKFFLVLDDVWNENYGRWNSLKSYFQAAAKGSKIIVTTRNANVASIMGNSTQHTLKTMSDDDCWKLFQKHAFHHVEPDVHLEEIGRDIVKKCKGLPLAIMSLAGLLCSVTDPKEWKEILKSDVWELQKKGNDEILPSLWLSYSYLPSHIKRCFAYCSIFPKDYKYNKQEMILLWMAEGFLQGENMEDIGDRCIKTLLSMSLFMRSTDDDSTFSMHDLAHDLATFVSGKGICINLGMGINSEGITNKTRHLLCGDKNNTCLRSIKALSKDNHVLTFLYLQQGYQYPIDRVFVICPRKFRFLRVLGISNRHIRKVPNSIGKLKHLRYLDLSQTRVKRLPDSICSLYNLQTLLLRGCSSLTRLPDKLYHLTNLRHLDITETDSLKKIPRQIYELEALRTVNKFVLGSGSRVKGIRKFPNIFGCLEIYVLENRSTDVEDVLQLDIRERSRVTELILHWHSKRKDTTNDKAVLDATKPHENVRKLSIIGFGGIELSDWVADHSFSNITDVSLLDCFHCSQLPPFGQLPSLKKLQIGGLWSIKTISSEFYGSSGGIPFKSLEILEIESMEELQSWSSFEAGAFPCLKKLSLRDCPLLNSTLPHSLPSLKELGINNCPQMEALLPLDSVMSSAFPSLTRLDISRCQKLKFLGFPLPTNLNYRSYWGTLWAHEVKWDLKSLSIGGYQDVNMDSFVDTGLLPESIGDLEIYDAPNLKAIGGKVLQHLKKLLIQKCPELECLPEEGLPASLSRLVVEDCPLLAPRLTREIGQDWHKIAHIPYIKVSITRSLACFPLSPRGYEIEPN